MSIFDRIKNAIFHRDSTATTKAATPASTAPARAAPTQASATSAPSSSASANAANAAPQTAVDVEAVLNGLAAKNPQKLNWQTSIVDLMKLVDLDSSLQNRKELAKELGYSGDTNDSAAMNIWLHKQVMNKLAANGGKVPASLRD